jgi:hypothetical protein
VVAVVEHFKALQAVQAVQAVVAVQHQPMVALVLRTQAVEVQVLVMQLIAAAMVVQVLLFLNTQTPAQLQLVLV